MFLNFFQVYEKFFPSVGCIKYKVTSVTLATSEETAQSVHLLSLIYSANRS